MVLLIKKVNRPILRADIHVKNFPNFRVTLLPLMATSACGWSHVSWTKDAIFATEMPSKYFTLDTLI